MNATFSSTLRDLEKALAATSVTEPVRNQDAFLSLRILRYNRISIHTAVPSRP